MVAGGTRPTNPEKGGRPGLPPQPGLIKVLWQGSAPAVRPDNR